MLARPTQVLHLAPSDNGGVGIAALRLVDALRTHQAERLKANLLALNCSSNMSFVYQVLEGIPSLEDSIFRRAHFKPYGLNDYCLISPALGGVDILNHPLYKKADIVHLHAAAGFLNLSGLLKISTKPLVITLHDYWFASGGCHYPDECRGYESDCLSCPQSHESLQRNIHLNKLWKDAFYEALDEQNLSLVAPSNYLANGLRRTKLAEKKKITVIPNVIKFESFRIPREIPKVQYSTFRLGFVCTNLNEGRKNFRFVIDLCEKLKALGTQYTLVVRSSIESTQYLEYKNVKIIENYDEFFDEVDTLLLPSQEDNLPNVCLEAWSKSIPVVVSPNNGIAELISLHGGGLVLDLSTSLWAQAITSFINGEAPQAFLSRSSFEKLRELFEPKTVAKKYSEIYAGFSLNTINANHAEKIHKLELQLNERADQRSPFLIHIELQDRLISDLKINQRVLHQNNKSLLDKSHYLADKLKRYHALLRASRVENLIIYGTGGHSKLLMEEALELEMILPISKFIVSPKALDHNFFMGFPVLKANELSIESERKSVILLSSKSYEEDFLDICRQYLPDIRIIKIYSSS